jgi:hypothetical protein
MLNHQRRIRLILVAMPLVLLLVVGTLATRADQAGAEQTVTPLGEAVGSGPWQITVSEVKLGDDASAFAQTAGDPAEPPETGLQYVAAHLTMNNASSIAFQVLPEDFGVMGNAGIERRTSAVFVPDPALIGTVAGGASIDGWVLSSVENDASSIVLLYDSATISGTWADHAFALTDGATLNPSTERPNEIDRDGRDPGAPVGPGRVISTSEWTVKITNVVVGPPVLDLVPDETQRLGQNYQAGGEFAVCLDNWVAIEFTVTNNADDGLTRYLPQTAFLIADADGSPVLDVRELGAPIPEVGGEYEAGATRNGWIAFELPSRCQNGEANLDYSGDLLRFQPFATSDDVRFLTWDGEGASAAPTEATIDENDIWPVGTVLVVAKDATVNLRTDPSTTADVRDELDEGTEVEVTGDPQSAGGYIWYPIKVSESGDEGWAVADYLTEP